MEGVLYHVAHDLRAPVRALAGLTGLLLKEGDSSLNTTGREYAQRIFEAGKQMDVLILDLLAYGRLSHVELSLAPIKLAEAVNRVAHRIAQQTEITKAQITLGANLPEVLAHAETLETVLA